jgi:hypothetical protein
MAYLAYSFGFLEGYFEVAVRLSGAAATGVLCGVVWTGALWFIR